MIRKLVQLFDRDTILHLRLPFSFFLLPVFCFGISQANPFSATNAFLVFLILHFFIYPGSNIYNSYMDKDKGSIGGLQHPPPVTKKMYHASLLLDCTGLLLSLLISWRLLFLMLVYVSISKAYSWRGIRLKKFGYLGWLVVMLFQGGYTFLLVNMSAENYFGTEWFSNKNLEAMLIASLLIGGFYPLTQIYQHEEDRERNDFTISYRLGITGTFVFSGGTFLVACAVAWHYFNFIYNNGQYLIFIGTLIPVIIYFLYWFGKVYINRKFADYVHTMRMTFISSLCMIICFAILFFLNHEIRI